MSIASESDNAASSLSGPVIYRHEDYIGLFRRLLIFAVDGVVMAIGLAVIFAVFGLAGAAESKILGLLTSISSLVFVWWYLAMLKPSRMRSPGYWIADAKIVTLYGESPTTWRMTVRMMWMLTWFIGLPFDVFIDTFWATMGDDRQTMRDLICETRLIRNRAKPIGRGKISYCLCTCLGRTLYYARVH